MDKHETDPRLKNGPLYMDVNNKIIRQRRSIRGIANRAVAIQETSISSHINSSLHLQYSASKLYETLMI